MITGRGKQKLSGGCGMRMKWLALLAAGAVLGWGRGGSADAPEAGNAQPAPAAGRDIGRPVFPPPPRLAVTAPELAAMRSAPDAAARREAAVRAAQPLLDNPPPLPAGYGSWIFYYACPADGETLRMITLEEHKCPACGQVYRDARTVAAYRCLMHHAIEHAAVTLGWAYAWTGDERYALGVRRILLRLADDYASYPARLDRWGRSSFLATLGGRRYVQSLDEAVGVIRLAKGYDLTRNAKAWSAADRKHVEEDFFRATADSIARFTQPTNHQTWFNAGMIAVGSTLGDAALIERVLTMRDGVLDQLDNNLGSDGLWYEGTLVYHNYALQALIETVDITRRLGMRLEDHPKLKLAITAPLRVAYPNGQCPAINDSDAGNLGAFGRAFEWGWNTYHDPVLAQALAGGNAEKLRQLIGAAAVVQWPPALPSETLAGAGLVVLRRGGGAEAVCVFLDYGPHGGEHGHCDKLNLMLFANGREWLLDPGWLTYSHKEYKTWVQTTAAHNTVALGGRSQAPHAGRLLWFSDGPTWSAAAAESTNAYPGATLRRYLALGDRALVDVFEVKAAAKTQIDLLAHSTARKVAPVGAAPDGAPVAPGDDDGYQHLTQASLRALRGDSQWEFTDDRQRLVAWLVHEPGEQLIACSGIGYNTGQKTPTLIRRRQARATRFICVYDLSGAGAFIRGVQARLAGGEVRLDLDTTAGAQRLGFSGQGLSLPGSK